MLLETLLIFGGSMLLISLLGIPTQPRHTTDKKDDQQVS